MAELLTLEALFTLIALIFLQAVLGFDNLLYIAIESNKVGDPEDAKKVRKWGIGIAVALRIILLFVIVALFGALAKPLFNIHLGNLLSTPPLKRLITYWLLTILNIVKGLARAQSPKRLR